MVVPVDVNESSDSAVGVFVPQEAKCERKNRRVDNIYLIFIYLFILMNLCIHCTG